VTSRGTLPSTKAKEFDMPFTKKRFTAYFRYYGEQRAVTEAEKSNVGKTVIELWTCQARRIIGQGEAQSGIPA